MSSIPGQSVGSRLDAQACVAWRGGGITRVLDAALTRRATPFWWTAFACLLSTALLLHVSAWIGIPTVATPDTNSYCEIMHTMEAGRLPDLRDRNIGYPLFMYACKALPLPLNKALPLVQHVLELAASVILMIWMRRNWGVAASLITGALLLVNSGRVIWLHYGHPNGLLISLVPLASLALLGWLTRQRLWMLIVSSLLWIVVLLHRDEVLMLAGTIPFALLLLCRPVRRACLQWYGVVALIALLGVGGRSFYNRYATGNLAYATHAINIVAWRGLHTDELVAPPRPEKLERLYQAALADGAEYRCRHHLHYEDLWRAAHNHFGMTKREAIDYMAACAVECIRRRPGAYARAVLHDSLALWLYPRPNLEWEAVRLSDPEKFSRDGARLQWATHARAEFPLAYETSPAQRLFRKLAVVRPGETFAMKPLAVCFVIGTLCLLFGVGSRRRRIRRWWFLGLAASVVFMTLFYAATIDVPHRFRLTVEWSFFVIASLGIVLPMRALRRRMIRVTTDPNCERKRPVPGIH